MCTVYVCILKCGHLERCKKAETSQIHFSRYMEECFHREAGSKAFPQSLTTKSTRLFQREVEGRSLVPEVRSSECSYTFWSTSRTIVSTDYFYLINLLSKMHL